MAHVEVWYRCPVCDCAYNDQREAEKCRNQHPIKLEQWAVGKHKAVRIYDNHTPDSIYGANRALREADLSDFTAERRRQLEELKRKETQDGIN